MHETVGSFVHCIEACLQQIDLSMLSVDCTPLIGAQERHSEMLQRIDNSADKLRPEVVLAWDGKRCKGMEAVKQTGRNAGPWTSWTSQRSNAERSIFFEEFHLCKWMIQTENKAGQNCLN